MAAKAGDGHLEVGDHVRDRIPARRCKFRPASRGGVAAERGRRTELRRREHKSTTGRQESSAAVAVRQSPARNCRRRDEVTRAEVEWLLARGKVRRKRVRVNGFNPNPNPILNTYTYITNTYILHIYLYNTPQNFSPLGPKPESETEIKMLNPGNPMSSINPKQ